MSKGAYKFYCYILWDIDNFLISSYKELETMVKSGEDFLHMHEAISYGIDHKTFTYSQGSFLPVAGAKHGTM